MKVYVAAASAELERARIAMAKIRAAGIEVTSTWIETIEHVGEANPREATDSDRATWAGSCLRAVAASDEVLVLVPPTGVETIGAWIEVGFAIHSARGIYFAGDTRRTVFAALGEEYATDDAAIAELIRRAALGDLDDR